MANLATSTAGRLRKHKARLRVEPPSLAPVTLRDLQSGSSTPGRVPRLLMIAAFSILVFPSNMVVESIGASGTVPMLLALTLFLFWGASTVFGLHDPIGFRHPGRVALALLLLSTCMSYVALQLGLTGGSAIVGRNAADRWLILMASTTGLIMVTTECVRTINDALMLVRAILAGAYFCCLVALTQFIFRVNPMEWIEAAMPLFVDNGGNTPFQARGALMRVAGSTFHSIELAVVCSMLLPLSLWRGIFDPVGRKWLHWSGTALLIFAIASTVSRSGVLGLVIGMSVTIPFLPKIARRWAAVVSPVVLALLFLAVPGLMSTLFGSVTAGTSDPSISTRTDDYPRVAAMIAERPLLGTGPGNFMSEGALYILDNQYLNAAVTMGLIGLACVIVYLFVPGLAGVVAARAAASPALKSLTGAVAAGCLVAGVCSLTFDSMSFPVFALIYPLLVGLFGAAWIMVKRELVLLRAHSARAHQDPQESAIAASTIGGTVWTQ
jgi:putative inorganic carbon (hco3(-)) transporter